MKLFLIVFSLVCSVLHWRIANAQEDTISLVTYKDFPPFVTDALPGGGFINEIVLASFDAAGIEVNISYVPWKRSYRAVARGEYLASHSWAHSVEREKDFHFSMPLFSIANRLLTTIPDLKNWEQLTKNRTPDDLIILCTPIGWKVAIELEEMIENGSITMMTPSQPRSCMELMRAERTDLIYMPEITAAYHLEMIRKEESRHPTRAWPEIKAVTMPSGEQNTQHVIFTKTDIGLNYRDRFDQGFKKIVKDGTYLKILNRFLSKLDNSEQNHILLDQINAGIIPAEK